MSLKAGHIQRLDRDQCLYRARAAASSVDMMVLLELSVSYSQAVGIGNWVPSVVSRITSLNL